mmetsp:Transcript_121215/g.350047  ORF Transcript_121215/g.350047 Transcript_121215/m.350047 type:complete len:237 (-) Transcript_121215:326-1036(-)
MSKFRVHHRHPSELAQKPLRRVAAEGDLADLVVAACQENGEARLLQPLLRGHHTEEAELRGQGKTLQAQAQNPVEGEGVEGLVAHLDGRDDSQLEARRWRRDRRRGCGCCFGAWPCDLNARRSLRTQADVVADNVANDLARAEGDRDLVPRAACWGRLAVVVDVHRVDGHPPLVPPVDLAGLALALAGGHDDMSGAGVEHDGEVLWRRRANGDRPEVDAFVRQGVVVDAHGQALAA